MWAIIVSLLQLRARCEVESIHDFEISLLHFSRMEGGRGNFSTFFCQFFPFEFPVKIVLAAAASAAGHRVEEYSSINSHTLKVFKKNADAEACWVVFNNTYFKDKITVLALENKSFVD